MHLRHSSLKHSLWGGTSLVRILLWAGIGHCSFSCSPAVGCLALQGRESQVIGLQILAAKASGFQEIPVVFGDFSDILFLVVYTDDKD